VGGFAGKSYTVKMHTITKFGGGTLWIAQGTEKRRKSKRGSKTIGATHPKKQGSLEIESIKVDDGFKLVKGTVSFPKNEEGGVKAQKEKGGKEALAFSKEEKMWEDRDVVKSFFMRIAWGLG